MSTAETNDKVSIGLESPSNDIKVDINTRLDNLAELSEQESIIVRMEKEKGDTLENTTNKGIEHQHGAVKEDIININSKDSSNEAIIQQSDSSTISDSSNGRYEN